MALFGIYYRLTPQAAQHWLAKVHAGLAISGVVVMVSGLYVLFSGGSELGAIIGGVLTFASMLTFLYTVIRHGFGQADEAARAPRAAMTPASDPKGRVARRLPGPRACPTRGPPNRWTHECA
jgi:hypothetical protein